MIGIRIHTALAVAAAAVLLAGCGSSSESTPETSTPTGPAATSAAPGPDESSPDQVVLDVTVSGGEVRPTNEQRQAAVGQPIVIRVDSDAADELHVHSTPEHTFPVAAGPDQTFEFTVEMPGRVDVELHNTHTTIATILVR